MCRAGRKDGPVTEGKFTIKSPKHASYSMHVFAQYLCFVSGEETDQQDGDEEGAGKVRLPGELA